MRKAETLEEIVAGFDFIRNARHAAIVTGARRILRQYVEAITIQQDFIPSGWRAAIVTVHAHTPGVVAVS